METIKHNFWVSMMYLNVIGEVGLLREINPDGLEILKIIRTDAETEPEEYNRHIIIQCIEWDAVHYEIILRPHVTNMNVDFNVTDNL